MGRARSRVRVIERVRHDQGRKGTTVGGASHEGMAHSSFFCQARAPVLLAADARNGAGDGCLRGHASELAALSSSPMMAAF